MSVNSLPSEILDQICSYVAQQARIDSPTKTRTDENYTSFTLISKSWSGVARRCLLKSLTIRNADHVDEVIKGISKSCLGGVVKSLEIIFQPQISTEEDKRADNVVPSLEDIKRKDMISYVKFITLAKLLPSLATLRLIRPTFIRFRLIDARDLTIFPTLSTLFLEEVGYLSDHIIVREMLTMAPGTANLSILGDNLTTKPIRIFKPLRSLVLRSWKALKFSTLTGDTPLLASTIFEGMKMFEIKFAPINYLETSNNTDIKDVLEILRIAGSSLDSFRTTFRADNTDIIFILSLLPRLALLRIRGNNPLSNDVIDAFPTSLHTVEHLRFSSSNLAYLQQLPLKTRPTLISIELSEVSIHVLRLLPPTLQSFDIGDIGAHLVLKALDLSGRSLLPKPLSSMLVSDLGWIRAQDSTMVSKFRNFGIALQ